MNIQTEKLNINQFHDFNVAFNYEIILPFKIFFFIYVLKYLFLFFYLCVKIKEKQWEDEWGSNIVFNNGTNNAKGVAIF